MIKASDLRIGNWVVFNDNTDGYGRTKSIHEYDIKLSCRYIPDHQENAVVECSIGYEFVHPIEISPEILEKAGFIEYGGKHFNGWAIYEKHFANPQEAFEQGFNPLLILTEYFEPRNYLENGFTNATIGCLHQLQNLFYCLVGEELRINLLQ
jgi:hypothetical protein